MTVEMKKIKKLQKMKEKKEIAKTPFKFSENTSISSFQ